MQQASGSSNLSAEPNPSGFYWVFLGVFFSPTRECESVGEREKRSHCSLLCLIFGSMTLSPCQPLLLPWKPAFPTSTVWRNIAPAKVWLVCMHVFLCFTALNCHLNDIYHQNWMFVGAYQHMQREDHHIEVRRKLQSLETSKVVIKE